MKEKNIKKILFFLILFYITFLSAHTIGKKRHHDFFYKILHPKYRKYTLTLPSKYQNSGYLWFSLPILDRKSRFIHFDPDVVEWAFSDILSPFTESKVKEIRIKQPGNMIRYVRFNNSCWENVDYKLSSTEGYKISCEFDKPVTLNFYGYKENENTKIKLYPKQSNWIGYFLEKDVYPSEAFGKFWPYILSIKTQHWSWDREFPMNPDKYTISFGDMLEVTTSKMIVFNWNKKAKKRKRKKVVQVKHFTFSEKFNYRPLFVYIASPTPKPLEIGVFQDDVCVGAAFVNDSLISIPAYLNEDIKESTDFNLIGYYPKLGERVFDYTLIKSNSINKTLFALINGFSDENKDIKFETRKNSKTDTTIKYSIPKDEFVTIEIYNLKGQKVKTVVKGKQKAGYYKVDWNGTNDNGKRVASGVYLYRLKTKSKNLIRKMILLK